ncbi:MAG TPA: type II 3-dehydroquinate dehydratase [Candidatus Cybelea sp.]|jgi:3-dehydroquinate dehydratase-2|nr:type II 3-dehydroquinate dehydratase [Candidatus Cybelea sp.]
MRVLVVHGPNLNLLGEREPEIYGRQTLAELNEAIAAAGNEIGIEVRCEQHNSEGAIIDALHAARKNYDGVIINPGAYAHYSYAIRDAIAAIALPTIEVHLSNIAARERFRRTSVTAAACRGVVGGFGATGYALALRAIAESLARSAHAPK